MQFIRQFYQRIQLTLFGSLFPTFQLFIPAPKVEYVHRSYEPHYFQLKLMVLTLGLKTYFLNPILINNFIIFYMTNIVDNVFIIITRTCMVFHNAWPSN